ncbi:hypothetical protein K474DRAFT_1712429 [Panus rudis PR-1116 ss-1]|nr:hypothetical protein K474DRAFT_1712429 [Panus rudis PR-1116 ss-1]
MFSPDPPPALQHQQQQPIALDGDKATQQKAPVVRGARACTVCRQAKMKCVGGQEGVKCQRCQKSGNECIFEKHRRGRKPGSKLSDASRALRHLEKGLSDAKAKVQSCANQVPAPSQCPPSPERFPNNELPPLKLPLDLQPGPSRSAADPAAPPSHTPMDVEPDEKKQQDNALHPAHLIRREGPGASFFKTILNPEPHDSPNPRTYDIQRPPPPPRSRSPALPPIHTLTEFRPAEARDPISVGLIDEKQAQTLFDLFFLRLNPFINLFDPALHTVPYVRSRSSFLFTVLIMACCKFFKPELYRDMLRMANEMAGRAFAEGWKSVEVVQAFACMTYWRDPEDGRTWTFIGYACRLAVELGLNTYLRHLPSGETDFQLRERRNRERTYLVLFVHDRSLSIQTGRLWMLPEDEFVRHSMTWHSDCAMTRPEDTVIAAFVQLQRIASETQDAFNAQKESASAARGDAKQEDLLRSCNGRLTQWMDTWHHEMRRANGEKFHMAFLSLFRLNVRLFLNSFGIQAAMSTVTPVMPSKQALSACYASAIEILEIVVCEFSALNVLRYTQESITVMTAYASVFLLKLLRSQNTASQLHEGAMDEIYSGISKVADAYYDVSQSSPTMTSAAYHATFLRDLIDHDVAKSKLMEQQRRQQQLPPADFYRRAMPALLPPSEYAYHNGAGIRLPPVQTLNASSPTSAGPSVGGPSTYKQEYASPTAYSPHHGSHASHAYPSPSPSHSEHLRPRGSISGASDTGVETYKSGGSSMKREGGAYADERPPPTSSAAAHQYPPVSSTSPRSASGTAPIVASSSSREGRDYSGGRVYGYSGSGSNSGGYHRHTQYAPYPQPSVHSSSYNS